MHPHIPFLNTLVGLRVLIFSVMHDGMSCVDCMFRLQSDKTESWAYNPIIYSSYKGQTMIISGPVKPSWHVFRKKENSGKTEFIKATHENP